MREDLSSAGVSLLIDESLIVPTRLGDVQMVWLNWWGNGISSEGKLELEAVQDSMPAYVLLHNPEVSQPTALPNPEVSPAAVGMGRTGVAARLRSHVMGWNAG